MRLGDEADRLLLQVIEAQPYGELANQAKALRGSIAARDLRTDQPFTDCIETPRGDGNLPAFWAIRLCNDAD